MLNMAIKGPLWRRAGSGMILSPSFWKVSETKNSDKVSHVTSLSELNEMVQLYQNLRAMPKINIWISQVLLSWCSCLKEHYKCSQSNVSIFGIMKRFLFLSTIGLHKIKEIYVRLWQMMIVVIVNLCVLQNLAWYISSEHQGHRFHRFIVIWPTYFIIFRVTKNRAVFLTIFFSNIMCCLLSMKLLLSKKLIETFLKKYHGTFCSTFRRNITRSNWLSSCQVKRQ